MLVCPKDNDDVFSEPTIAPEGANIAGSEGATHLPAFTNIASNAQENQVVIHKDQTNQILCNTAQMLEEVYICMGLG